MSDTVRSVDIEVRLQRRIRTSDGVATPLMQVDILGTIRKRLGSRRVLTRSVSHVVGRYDPVHNSRERDDEDARCGLSVGVLIVAKRPDN